MSINIKGHSDILIHLNVKLLDTILTENTEHASARILTRNLYHIFL